MPFPASKNAFTDPNSSALGVATWVSAGPDGISKSTAAVSCEAGRALQYAVVHLCPTRSAATSANPSNARVLEDSSTSRKGRLSLLSDSAFPAAQVGHGAAV